MAISSIEKGSFLALFNRGGYVLDFITADFDIFTLQSVGVALCEKYRLSKGKSLIAFLNEADDCQSLKLLSDLLEYYELHYQNEINGENNGPYDTTDYRSYYLKCRECIDRESNSIIVNHQKADLAVHFTSEYMQSQIEILFRTREENPTEAIGKAKELVESCCKTILEENGLQYGKACDAGRLIKETMECLNVAANDINENQAAGSTIKQILGSLSAVVQGLAELRNPYGTGHGKSDSYKGLSARHSKLAVGASVTLVEYLWDVHEWRKAGKA